MACTHIIDPELNKMLPKKVFNQISDALTAFEEEKDIFSMVLCFY